MFILFLKSYKKHKMYFSKMFFDLIVKIAKFNAFNVRFSQILKLLQFNKSFCRFRDALINVHYRRFFIYKCFLYSYCFLLMCRSFLMSYLQHEHGTSSSILANQSKYSLFLGPMFICAVEQFNVMSLEYTSACCGLLAIYSFYTDYAIFFHFDSFLVEISYDLMIRNTKDFFKLNHQFAGKYIGNLKAIWTLEHAQFSEETLKYYSLLSHNVRAKAVLLSNFFELLIASLIFFGCMI